MRKLLLFFLAAGLIAFSCNNNKEKSSGKKGGKDNYLNGKEGDEENNDDDNSSEWSSGDIRKFNSECAKGMESEGIGQDIIDKICPCVFEKVSKRWSSFTSANETKNTSAISKMTEDCVSELGLGNGGNTDTDNNSGGGWSSADVRKFKRECKEELSGEQLDENTAATVCDCLLGKVQRKYSDYAEMDDDDSDAGKKMVEDCVRKIGGGQ